MRFLPPLLIAAALALPAPAAHAATYCVAKPGCVGTEATLGDAMAAAQSSGQPDRIEVGPGEHPTASGFVHDGSPENTLELIGSGSATVLRANTGSKAQSFTVLRVTGAGSAVRDLAIAPPAPSGAAITTGLALEGGVAERVTIAKGAGSAVASRGVRLAAGAVLRGAVVNLAPDQDVPGVVATAGEATVLDSAITGGTAAQAVGGAKLVVRRSNLKARFAGLRARGATVEAESVVVTAPQQSLDAVLEALAAGAADGRARASHVSATAPGGAAARAITTTAGDAEVAIDNSILSGNLGNTRREASGGGSAFISLVRTHRNPGQYDQQTGAGATTLTELVPESFSWVDVTAGDLRLTGHNAGPLDRANATPVVPGTGLDAGGLPRAIDADYDGATEADLGAHEYQFQAPVVVLSGPAAMVTGERAVFSVAVTDPDPGETFGMTPIWASGLEDFFGDTPPMGPTLTLSWKRPGVKTVRVLASDPRGKSTTAERQVTVTGPDLTQQPPPPPPPGDTTAPALKGVRLAKKGAVKRGKAVAVRLELSEPARVTAVLQRKSGKRYKRVRRVRKSLPAGKATLTVPTKRLKRGRYRLRITAKDAAGNVAAARTVKLKLR